MKITDFSYKTEMKVTTCLRRSLPSLVTAQFYKWNSMSFTEGFHKHFISLLSGIVNEENRPMTLYIFKKIKHPNQYDQGECHPNRHRLNTTRTVSVSIAPLTTLHRVAATMTLNKKHKKCEKSTHFSCVLNL